MLGHSGATIEIREDTVKKSKAGIAFQARYCIEHMGVFPAVREYDMNSYVMERLDPNNMPDIETTQEALALVAGRLWNKHAPFYNDNWRKELVNWAKLQGFNWITEELVLSCYPCNYDQIGQSKVCIHGDLTLSNMMRRHGKLIFIDPLPAGGKIPPFKEVDYAKLMQSALGWETLLRDGKARRDSNLVDLLYRHSYRMGVLPKKMELWTAVHLARIVPYAQRDDISNWALFHSERICNELSARI